MVPLGLTPSRLLVARLAGGSFLRLELVIADGVLDEDPEEVTGDEVRRRHPLEFVHEGGLAHLIRLLEAQEVADQAFTSKNLIPVPCRKHAYEEVRTEQRCEKNYAKNKKADCQSHS